MLKSSFLQKQNNQSGVTLLLSVLILSGVSMITLTVGALALQEIRSSRAVALSEPAIIAAESGGEEGLWEIKRTNSLPTCNSQGNIVFNTLGEQTSVAKCRFHTSGVFEVGSTNPVSFFLYDPDDINGNLNPGYTHIVVTHKGGNHAVSVSIRTADDQPCNACSQSVAVNSVVTIPSTQNLPALTQGNDERYKVTLSASGNAIVEVSAFCGEVNCGLPDYPTVDSQGCSARVNPTACTGEAFRRKINITVPQ